MTTRYVGAGGNDANTGLSWAQRKLTLNGVEDTPVAATDIVYVGPGTYRELLTVDVSGAAGQVISYIGDYTGANTDGVGGIIRITGSDNDQTATRASCITATSKDYRTFQGFVLDTTTGSVISLASCTNCVIDECYLSPMRAGANCIQVAGATQATTTVSNCFFIVGYNANAVLTNHTVTVSNTAHVVSNCVGFGARDSALFASIRVGGVTVKNSIWLGGGWGVYITTALAAGQTITANNCIIASAATGLAATVLGEITEDYNDIFGCNTARSNVGVGANSLAYSPLFDARWFLQLVTAAAANQVISPFDLASYSQLINVAGTAPTATDMRGTAAIGGQREWGALEYDATLEIEGGGGLDLPEPLYVGA